MCSISGIVGAADGTRIVTRMNAEQRHRGPDDQGVVRCAEQVVLGNTRLAIIDRSVAGRQPMHDPVTGNWVTYNGETYNFRELRLALDGEAWGSNTDTEVVLRAYRKWGTDAFRRMRGMFALAIWDELRQTLVLARDPLGIKPLYYFVGQNQLLFASELRALLASGLAPRRLSVDGVDSYLACGAVQSPLTIVDGIRQLLPGHYLEAKVSGTGAIEFVDVEFAHQQAQQVPRDRAEAVARLRAELEESLRLHLVSDVPLGVFLSGGMDSSALVGMLPRIVNKRPKTFSVVFDEAKFNEAPFSRAVAKRFETDHNEIRLSERDLIDILPDAIDAIDQPTMDGINTYVVSRAVKQAGLTVALSGLGGDELFAGYPSFRRAMRVAAMSGVSKRVLRAAAGVGKVALNGSVQRHKLWELANSEGGPADVYRISRQLFSNDYMTRMTGREAQTPECNNGNHSDPINTISRLELNGYMTNTLLRDTDAMSMAHSLEVRVPFVDRKVVDYVLSLPGEWKMDRGSRPKALLADAVADLLPRDFMSRPKMGFTLPFEKWMQHDLRSEISSVFQDPCLSAAGLNAGAVRKIWHDFIDKPRAVGWSRPWSLYVLAKWCERNGVTSA